MTFLEILDRGRNELSDARDWLNSDWSGEPPAAAVLQLRSAQRHIALAKDAIDAAKSIEYRHRAPKDDISDQLAQYQAEGR